MKALLAAITLSAAIPFLDRCSDSDHGLALGIIERERVTHVATVSELIVELPVPEGTAVSQGDVLVRLDDTIQRSLLSLAEAELASARANLDKLLAGPRDEEIAIAAARVKGAEAALADAKATVTRNTVLAARDAVSQARLDTDQANQDAAQAELDSAREYLRELKNGARPEDIRIGETSVAAAQAKVLVERRRLNDLVVTASRDGVLDALPWNLGERVSAGSPVAIILAGERPFARVYVPEPYRVKVHEGLGLEVRVDGIDDPFQGSVRWISAEPAFTPYYALNQTDRARLMYLAEITLPESAAMIPSGVPAQAVMP